MIGKGVTNFEVGSPDSPDLKGTNITIDVGGSIGFVGLMVPHALRLFGIHDHRWLLPASALVGGSFVVLADTFARTVMSPQQLPVGVFTALIGVPVLLLLLSRRS